jgi:hypothetical protein
MATLFVTEFQHASAVGPGRTPMPIAMQPPLAEQAVSFTTSTASSAFNTLTQFVRLYASADCHIQFGTSPTATTSLMKLKADAVEYFAVPPGASYKVAAVTA